MQVSGTQQYQEKPGILLIYHRIPVLNAYLILIDTNY